MYASPLWIWDAIPSYLIQLHAEKKSGFLGTKNNMFKTSRVGQDVTPFPASREVTPKRELDRKSADKLHPL